MDYLHSEAMDRLYGVIASLRTEEECAAFFEDLCTVRELQDLSKRLDAAILLDRGLNDQEIAERAGISTATISRVNKNVRYGCGGFRAVLDRMHTEVET